MFHSQKAQNIYIPVHAFMSVSFYISSCKRHVNPEITYKLIIQDESGMESVELEGENQKENRRWVIFAFIPGW